MKLSALLCCAGALVSSAFAGDIPKALVEYVESNDGATYINTGVTVNPKRTRMCVSLSLNSTSGKSAVFGRGNSWANANSAMVLLQDLQFRLDYLGSQNNKIDCVADRLYTFDLCNNVGTVDGVKFTATTSKTDADSGQAAYLFNFNNNGSAYACAKMKLYSAAIWKDGTTLSGRYVPCVDNDDQTGVYDLVTQTIIYPSNKDGKTPVLTAASTPNPVYTLDAGVVKTKLTVEVEGTGGTTSESSRLVACGQDLTLTATPDTGMRPIWHVERDGRSEKYAGASITIKDIFAPLSVRVLFCPVQWLVTAEELVTAVNEATEGETIYLAPVEFALTQTITNTTGYVLEGAGRDATILTAANIYGERVAYLNHAKATFKNLTLTGANAQLLGAGVYMKNGCLDTVRVTKNYQRQANNDNYNKGAGVYMETGVITNSLIDYNYLKAGYHGSSGLGVYMKGGLVVDSEICHNWMERTQHNGIGIWASAGTIRRCRIYDNYSTLNSVGGSGSGNVSSGHGANLSGSAVLEDSLVYSNGWCGVMMTGSKAVIRNCAIFGHRQATLDWFAGVNMTAGTLVNSTITDNFAAGDTTGKSGLWQTGGTAVNNIIYGNGSSTLGSCCVTGGTFNHNVTDKAVERGTDCTVADPKFVDAANGNYHLTSSSTTAIDKGAERTDVPFDLDGVERPQKNAWDIGCYEYVPDTRPSAAISIARNDLPAGGTIAATAVTENIDETTAKFTWTLTGAASAVVEGIGLDFKSFAYPGADVGECVLSLVVTTGETVVPATDTETFTVKPLDVYVSLAGSATAPYDTPEKATANIGDALASVWQASDATTTVHVAAGTYVLTDMISVGSPIRILGAGRDATVFTCGTLDDSTRALLCAHPDALVKGVTFSGIANLMTGVGSCVRLEDGTLDSVRICDTVIKALPGSTAATAGGLYMAGGVATNMVIDGCTTKNNYGITRGLGVYMDGGILTDSVVCTNGLKRYETFGTAVYMTGGVLRRTKIFDCYAHDAGDTHGVGLALMNLGSSSPIAEEIEVRGCTNAVYVESGVLRNSLVADNGSAKGIRPGGLEMNMAQNLYLTRYGKVVNCTVAGNVSGGRPFDLLATNKFTIINTIAEAAAIATNATVSEVSNCILNKDPKFRRPDSGDYRLGPGSPAINAGDNEAWSWSDLTTAVDLGGKPRLKFRNIDVGCYEWTSAGWMLKIR